MEFTNEEALQDSSEYFFGDELAAKIVVDKYLLRDRDGKLRENTPEMMHRRLAKEFARIEQKYPNPLSEEKIFEYFDKFGKIIPQGSPMAAIGNPYQIMSLSNCEVIAAPEDSYGGICLTDQELAQLQKRRCGVGFDISTLRPKGLPTKNAAKTTDGIAVFMERFSRTTREVAQGGRRGALLLSISVHHPEIETFIKIKQDLSKVTGANISVRFSDEFMQAVEANTDYEQRWPVDSNVPVISKMVDAKSIWELHTECAWATAEPGCLFWDTIKRESPADCYKDEGFGTVSTNPCQPGWVPVLTKNGLTKLEHVNIGDEIWSVDGWTKVVNKVNNGVKEVYQYSTNGSMFIGTKEHRIVSNGKKIEVDKALSIDTLSGPYYYNIPIDTKDVIDGIVFGDGSVHKASDNLIYLCIGEDDQDYFKSEIYDFIGKYRPALGKTSYEVITRLHHTELPRTFERIIPDRYFYANTSKIVGFLRGLYTANGSICDRRVTLKASSKVVIQQVQIMLSSLGIKSYYTTNKSTEIEWQNGNYISRESYDLNITKDRDKFLSIIGFIQNYKNEILSNVVKKTKVSNKSKQNFDIHTKLFLSEETVYDITVNNESHTYWTTGSNVSNCAELTLSAYDSCRLIAINLTQFVQNPFDQDNCVFDYREFSKVVYDAQRLMDDMIDLELEHIDAIIEKIQEDPEPDDVKQTELNLWYKIRANCENGRRTGLGITGLGDTLAALDIKYGSQDSIHATNAIYAFLAEYSYQSSVDMAKERGHFPIFDLNQEKNHPFLSKILLQRKGLWQDYLRYGRRNIANLTTAPTGTISILARAFNTNKNNITSGIEPAFLLGYIRRRKLSGDAIKYDMIDAQGDKWEETEVYHSGYSIWKEISGKTAVEDSPYYKAIANDIDWEKSVDIQAAAQKWICHSISKTCNIPTDSTKELVGKIYMDAWKKGCKGFTVYRDGCRTGVLVANTDKKDKIIKTDAPDRPRSLPAKIFYPRRRNGIKFIVAAGLLGNNIYEIFSWDSFNGDIPEHISDGTIERVGARHYRLIKDGEVILENIGELADPDQAAINRLISGSLRHGMSVEYVQSQLAKIRGNMYDLSAVLSRVLRNFIENGTIAGELCPECNKKLLHMEGCVKCTCGFSKC